jgi:hypothetical protein
MDVHRHIQVIRTGTDQDRTAAGASHLLASGGEGGRIVLPIVRLGSEISHRSDRLDVRDAAIDPGAGPVRVDDTVGTEHIGGGQLVLGGQLVAALPRRFDLGGQKHEFQIVDVGLDLGVAVAVEPDLQRRALG